VLKRRPNNSYDLTPTCTKRLSTAVLIILVISAFVYVCCSKGGGRLILLSSALRPVETANPDNLPESAIQVWETVPMRVTAYCPCSICCGQYADGITASGHKIQHGDAFAAAGPEYSFGTEMIIPGYNGGKAVRILDRGGLISGNRLDVFFDSHQQALEWGVRYLQVKVPSR